MDRKKGQVISSDFMVSVAVFLIILAFILPLFVRLDEERHERFAQDDLQLKLTFVTDYILKTTGAPVDWNETNIEALGLANGDGHVNATKLRRFMKLQNQQAKDLLGLSGVEFNLSFYSNNYPLMTGIARSPAAYFFVNNKDMFPFVNGSGIVWDMYSAGTVPQSDARFVYQGAKAALFNELLDNSSAYRTIIIEEPELLQGQVNINLLQAFVDRGGIIIYEGSADLISSGFSASSGTAVDDGIVRDVSLIDAPIGSTVVFENPNWYFSGPSVNIWIERSTSGVAYAGYWNHGVGEIYYITDITGTVNGQPLSGVLNFIGSRAEFSTGLMYNKVTSSRAVVLDSRLNSMALAVMVVGK